ncbi:hypothetical protein [Streptomyces sp. NPDC055189]
MRLPEQSSADDRNAERPTLPEAPPVASARFPDTGSAGSSSEDDRNVQRPVPAEPPPVASARIPDTRPPDSSAPSDGDGEQSVSAAGTGEGDPESLLGDLLAPFDRVRKPRAVVSSDAAGAGESPPPPPASARFPDAPPPSAMTRTGPAPEPVLPPPLPSAPPRLGDEQRTPDYPLRPPMPPVPQSEPGAADISGRSASAEAAAPESISAPAPSRRTTAARRAVGAVDLTPGPGAGRPFVSFARPAMYDDSTTRLRPVRTWVQPRVTAAAACVVLGLGLIGGAATGSWLTGGEEGTGVEQNAYAVAGELWHSVPVDQLFPATIKGEGAGPGGADRTWTRIAVAPDSTCKNAFDPLLRKALASAGCLRLLRATYTDATHSHVTTVGLLFTKADADAMRSLRTRFTEEGLDRRPDLMPRPYAAKGTPAADFGDAQRASWTVSLLPDAPVVAFAVSGFADGRTVTEPEPAEEAMKTSATSAPAQAGLGHEAQGIADRVERRLRKTIEATEKSS